MKVVTNGITERYKIYKMYETIEGKLYIGKTSLPIYMRINQHRHGKITADKHFSKIGWENVTFEIIDWSYDNGSALKKESNYISSARSTHHEKLLNKHHAILSWCFPLEFQSLIQNYKFMT